MLRRQATAVGSVVATVVTLGAAVLVAAPDRSSEAAPARAGRLIPYPAMGAAGAPVRLTGRVGAESVHGVRLQRRKADRFVTIATSRTDHNGRFTFKSSLPKGQTRATYRVVGSASGPIPHDVAGVTPARNVLITNNTTKWLASASSTPPTPSADGRFVTYAESLRGSDSIGVFVWDRTSEARTQIADSVGGVSTPMITPDGRYVSYGSNRWEQDNHGKDVYFDDVYIWDGDTGTTTLVTATNTYGMTHGDDFTAYTDMSVDGRFIVYHSDATNGLVTDRNGGEDLFLWDRLTGTTTRLTNGNGYSYSPSISADGNFVVFASEATNLVPGPRNGGDVYLLDRTTGLIARVTAGNDASGDPEISADGRWVTFSSSASNLVGKAGHGRVDVFVWDRLTQATTRISRGNGFSSEPTISADGRYICYQSEATNLVSGDTNETTDLFVWDRQLGSTTRITNGTGPSTTPSISGDGRTVTFYSRSRNLTADRHRLGGVFLWTQTP